MADRAKPSVSQSLAAGALALCAGALAGVASGIFLALLDAVTRFRVDHERVIVWGLPLAGIVLGWLFTRGPARDAAGGAGKILHAIHDPSAPALTWRMAPAVLFGTLVTHAFGGSAGREGTAVQMGASLADQLATRAGCAPALRRIALVCGVAGGFGSVFGTPLAGAIFSLEYLRLGRVESRWLLPALLASLTGDGVARSLGAAHSHFAQAPATPLSFALVAKWLLFGALCGVVARAFVWLTHAVKSQLTRVSHEWARPAVGALVVLAGWKLFGGDFLGLGVKTIERAAIEPAAWWWWGAKLLMTAVTVGSGFVGGEVTPLFFVGSTLGSTLASTLGVSTALAATAGMSAVFGAASKAPLALAVMAAEIAGFHALPHAALVCATAFWVSGQASIYPGQR